MTSFISHKIKISVLLPGLIFFLQLGHTQSLQQAQQLFDTGQLPQAMEQVNSYTNSNGSDIQGWLWKARICAAAAADAEHKYLSADAKMDAYQALDKAVKLDKVYTTQQLKTDSFTLPLGLYNGYITDGIATFNTAAETKDRQLFATAFSTFKKAALLSNFIYSNGWGLSAIDTTILFYQARAAIQAGKEEDAAYYIRKLADAHITQTSDHKPVDELYKWLVYYYRTNGNADALKKYTQAGEAAFPAAAYFPRNYIDWLRQQKDHGALFAAYEALFAKGFNTAEDQYAYALDLFNYIYTTPAPVDKTQYQDKLVKLLQQYTISYPATIKSKLLLAKLYINQSADIQQELAKRSTTAPVIMKEYKTHIATNLNSANKYLLDIANNYKAADVKVYNEAIQLLVTNYIALNQSAQAKKYGRYYR